MALEALLCPIADPLVEWCKEHGRKSGCNGPGNLADARSDILLSQQLDQRFRSGKRSDERRRKHRVCYGPTNHGFRIIEAVAE